MKLIICGNGMDLHLGFRTSYPEYRNFLGKAKFIQGESAISIVENSHFLQVGMLSVGQIWRNH